MTQLNDEQWLKSFLAPLKRRAQTTGGQSSCIKGDRFWLVACGLAQWDADERNHLDACPRCQHHASASQQAIDERFGPASPQPDRPSPKATPRPQRPGSDVTFPDVGELVGAGPAGWSSAAGFAFRRAGDRPAGQTPETHPITIEVRNDQGEPTREEVEAFVRERPRVTEDGELYVHVEIPQLADHVGLQVVVKWREREGTGQGEAPLEHGHAYVYADPPDRNATPREVDLCELWVSPVEGARSLGVSIAPWPCGGAVVFDNQVHSSVSRSRAECQSQAITQCSTGYLSCDRLLIVNEYFDRCLLDSATLVGRA